MRKVMIIASLIVATGNVAPAAMPYFHGTDNRPAAAPKQDSDGWLSRMWGKKQTGTESPIVYEDPRSKPSITKRFTTALTDNPVTRTARGWTKSDTPAKDQVPDAISLSQPVGKPTPGLLVAMAQVREKQGDVQGARQAYLQALAAGPKNVKTLRELGHFEDRQNKLADAERYYAQAAAIAPQDAAVLNDLGLCLARQGKLPQSAVVLNQAIALAPSKALYRNNMATVLMELGDQNEAMKHLMAVHAPAAAYYNMGHLLQKGGEMNGATAHYAEALRLDPAMSAAQSALAKLSPQTEAAVPQTAMAPAATEPSFAPQGTWPSEPVTSPLSTPVQTEPEFGPRLLPPVQ